MCQRQCLYLNVDTDGDAFANTEIILLLLLIYFQVTNNLEHNIKGPMQNQWQILQNKFPLKSTSQKHLNKTKV